MNVKGGLLFSVTITVLSILGCATNKLSNLSLEHSSQYYNYIKPDFTRYVDVSTQWLKENRRFISNDENAELLMNAPFELKPDVPTNKAVLLVHGLGDSPFYFSDIAQSLVDDGYLVQVLLLPGHGSKPEDMLLPSYADWQYIVDHYAELLTSQYDEVWLGGYSTGANLVTINAIENDNIAGLLLFSPGFQSRTPFLEKLTPIIASVMDWGYQTQETNFSRYNSVTFNGAIAYSDSANILREKLNNKQLRIPTYIAVSEADSIIDPDAILTIFQKSFTHKNNVMSWYGERDIASSRVQKLTMKKPEMMVSTGSHMSTIFSPNNAYYGVGGSKKICDNSFDSDATKQCLSGEPVWFSAWGYEEDNKVHARLTWNPYFEQSGKIIKDIMTQ